MILNFHVALTFSIFPYLLALNAVTRSTENITAVKESVLPTPSIYGISDYVDEGPTIHWLLDENSDAESVLGYKVKLWQVGCAKNAKCRLVNGERVCLKNVMPGLRDTSTLRNLTEFTLEGVGNTSLFLPAIEHHVPYHMVVAAYGAGREGGGVREGPPSTPFRFQHRGRYTCREIKD